MKRLLCPNRIHPGILAPDRMKGTDLRRYCLGCSLETGFLAERVSPARQRRQAERRQRAQSKADGVKLASTSDGLDVRAEIVRLRDLPCWTDLGVGGAIRRVRITVFGGKGASAGGHYTHGKVHVTAGQAPGWYVSLVLIHELVHAADDARTAQRGTPTGRRRYHGRVFHDMLEDAATLAFGLSAGERERVKAEYEVAGGARRKYSMDRALERVIGARFRLEKAA